MAHSAAARNVARLLRKTPWTPLWRSRNGAPRFHFAGEQLPYFFHRRNYTWANERAVELSIAAATLQRFEGQRILEIGNVTRQYFATEHTVVDKYECAPGVINEDIVDYTPEASFDLILSISTLEHVGWDEAPREPDKIPRAIAKFFHWLEPGGEILLVVPVGYNPHLDRHLQDEAFAPFAKRYLRRVSSDNRWEEATWDEVRESRYHEPFDWANALAICRYCHK